MIYGYARVSSPGQDPERQIPKLEQAGCDKIVVEVLSAAPGRRRPLLKTTLALLQPDDVFMVVAMDRLARSTRDGLNIIEAILQRGAKFRSLEEPWADTTSPLGSFVATVLLGAAEFDRKMILKRTAEGRELARRNGVRLGRKPTLSRRQVAFVLQARDPANPNRLTIRELQTLLGVGRSTICRAARTPADQLADLLRPANGQIDLEDVIRAAG